MLKRTMVTLKVVAVLNAIFVLSEAVVTVEVISGLSTDKTIECGKQDIIRCVVSPFPGTAGYMAWNADAQALTQCFDGADNTCSSLAVDHYQFTSKPTDETFNLTFNTVKLSDSSVEFKCTDTIETGSVTPNVAVMPDTASTTNSSSGLELEVKTGCVFPDTAVTFEWYYMDNGDRNVLSTKSGDNEDSTGCMIGDCGGANVKKITSRLTTDSEGDEYNIFVDVIHADAPENDPNYVVTKSFGMFKVAIETTTSSTTTPAITTTIPPTTSSEGKKPKPIKITIIISVSVGVGLPLIIFVVTCLCLKRKRNQRKKANTQRNEQDELNFTDIVPNTSGSNNDNNESKNVTNSCTNGNNSNQADNYLTKQF